MLKSATLYNLKTPVDPERLNEAMQTQCFRSPGDYEMQAVGFAPISDELDLLHTVGALHLGAVRIDKKQLPASAIKQLLKERCAQIEQQQGFKPGRKQTKEIKEQIVDELLPKALHSTKLVRFMFTDNLLFVEGTSSSTCDVVLGLLAKVMDPFPLEMIYTDQPPALAMTNWLIEDEAPAPFTIDQEVEMKSPLRALVRWANASVDVKEAAEHIAQGKQCTKMALTWDDKISFMMSDMLVLSKIKPLDTMQPEELEPGDLDGSIALYGTSLRDLALDLLTALGGRKEV